MSDRDLLTLVNAARHYSGKETPSRFLSYQPNPQTLILNTWQEVLDLLVAENYRSVNYRYDEKRKPRKRKFRDVPLPPIDEIVKLTHCYDYQSCENQDYYTTPAAKVMQEIRDHILHHLPGYNEAPWGNPD